MKDESRELIEQYKDMYQKLNEQSIFSLRTYGREIGVAQPTLKKKEELIIHIIKIMNGLEAPAKQSNKGAPPKSQKVVWEKEDKSIKPVADDEGDKMVDLKITQNELVTLAELVYLGCMIGYDLVKEIYNAFGPLVMLQVIDLEGETLQSFKSKYISIRNLSRLTASRLLLMTKRKNNPTRKRTTSNICIGRLSCMQGGRLITDQPSYTNLLQAT